MTASGHPPNQLLQMLDAADFNLLRPSLAMVETVRETVLGEAGVALRHVYVARGRSVSITVGLSQGRMIGADTLSQLPIYPDVKMMELARPGSNFAWNGLPVQETGGSFGNDGPSNQRFPVRVVRR